MKTLSDYIVVGLGQLKTLSVVTVLLLAGCATPGPGSVGGSGGAAATEVLAAWKRADRLYARGEFLKAREAYQVVRKREPGNTEVLFKLGNIAYYLQDHELARELYDKVAVAGLDDPQLSYNRAALNLTDAYLELARYRDLVGHAGLTPEIRAVMSAIERMSAGRLPVASQNAGQLDVVGAGQ